ncbi:DoxX family protein [Sciscionella marina]|uniref:DoxX family protein n=1 Tax=Sciscionella marina TaxID=508770 RepID=UPI000378A1E6|nr:DoxX family protein [Sciscionella marina]
MDIGILREKATGPDARSWVLAAFRVVIALLYLLHALLGLFGLFGGVDGHGGAIEAFTFDWWVILVQLVTAVLLGIGLATRPAAVLCSGMMAYAYFTVHQPVGLAPLQNMGEPAALYSWCFLLLAVFGPGAAALGGWLRVRGGTRAVAQRSNSPEYPLSAG